MNIANKLTLLRIFLIPVFVFLLLWEQGRNPVFRYGALFVFLLASLTDMLDGYLARKYHLITNFGKFMDPLADKLLVSAALICFIELGWIQAWIVLTVISREFIISGFRLVASDAGIVIAAGKWGKIKTVVQMLAVAVLMLQWPVLFLPAQCLVYAMLILTLISLADYMVKNHRVLTEGEI